MADASSREERLPFTTQARSAPSHCRCSALSCSSPIPKALMKICSVSWLRRTPRSAVETRVSRCSASMQISSSRPLSAKMRGIRDEEGRIQERLTQADNPIDSGYEVLDAAFRLLANPLELYRVKTANQEGPQSDLRQALRRCRR